MKKLPIFLLTLAACSEVAWAQTHNSQAAPGTDSLTTVRTHCVKDKPTLAGVQVIPYPLSGRPVTSSLELHLGSASVRNTYLTPQLYTGSDLGLSYERQRDWRFAPWMSLQHLDAQFTTGEDRGQHSENWSGRLRYRYAAHYQWYWLNDFTLMAGPYLGAETGFDYNLKMASGNNPATARIALNLGLSLMGTWTYTLCHRQSIATLQLQAPLLGYAFMPEYGASYYETFALEGSQDQHHFASLHNQQDLDLRLTTDVPILPHRGGALRLGVAYHIETMDINHTVCRFSSLEAVVGWTFECMPLRCVNLK